MVFRCMPPTVDSIVEYLLRYFIHNFECNKFGMNISIFLRFIFKFSSSFLLSYKLVYENLKKKRCTLALKMMFDRRQNKVQKQQNIKPVTSFNR